MRTLIFSDTHFSAKFDQRRYDYIAHLINQVDQVIINGDFWDKYLGTFDQFINSPWRGIFPLLRQKQTVYLFGNHDPQASSDDKIKQFCAESGRSYLLTSGEDKFLIEHGDLHVPRFDYRYPRLMRFIDRYLPWLSRLSLVIVMIPVVQFQLQKPWHVNAQAKLRRHVHQLISRAKPGELESQIKCFIYGHCHLPLFSPADKICIVGGFLSGSANYLIIEDGAMKHFQEKY